jgi:hypothetical protein
LFKKRLAEMTVRSGWCLDVDIDEYFDYPYSDTLTLSGFLEYLNARDYTAVLTQMLDMFSDRPLSALAEAPASENVKEVYRYYDLSQVRKVDYRSSDLTRRHAHLNKVPNGSVSLQFGGIRQVLFGINCLLSKHSLFRMNSCLELFPHVHFVNRARLADVACVLLHYKLVGNAYETALQNKDAFHGTSKGYNDLMTLIEEMPDRRIKSDTSVEFRSTADLVESGFLFASDAYVCHAERRGVNTTPLSSCHAGQLYSCK